MNKLSPVIIKLFCISCLVTFCSTITFAQTNPTNEPERKIRYITSQKSNPATRPRIRIIKRGSIGKAPTKSIVKLKTNDRGLEKLAFKLINQKRFEKSLSKLEWSDKLANLARQHSENMAQHTFFSHIGLNGRLIDQRAVDFGINKWQAIGENIAYNKGFEKPADFAVERWMLSTTHRSNLLDPRWTQSGIGVGITENGTYYFTQVFLVK